MKNPGRICYSTAASAAERGAAYQRLIYCVAAYLASPHDVGWHVRRSWDRLLAHLTPSLTVILLLALAAPAQARAQPPLDAT